MNQLLSAARLEVQLDIVPGIYAVCVNCNKRFTSIRSVSMHLKGTAEGPTTMPLIMNDKRMKHTRYVILALLILIPSIINLSTPLYNRKLPDLFGMPFFYLFQTLWLVVCSGFYLTFAHLINEGKEKEEDTVNR